MSEYDLDFGFLIYVPRSGSTYVARHIGGISKDILVTPEFRLPALLMMYGENKIKSLTSEQLLALFKLDYQISNLGLSDSALASVANECVGKGSRRIIEALVFRHAEIKGTGPKMVIIKNGYVLYVYRALRRCFPGCAFVHVIRDARGVSGSLLKTRSSHNRRPMGKDDIIYCTRLWVQYLRKAKALEREAESSILAIRYEDFLNDPGGYTDFVVEWLQKFSGRLFARDGNKSFYYVPDREKDLHKLVYKEPQLSRSLAWREELKPWQGITIERLGGPWLARYGYAPNFTKDQSHLSIFLSLLTAYFFHFRALIYQYSLRMTELGRMSVLDPKRGIMKIRQFLYRYWPYM